MRGTASALVGCERDGGEVDGQIDVACSWVDLVGKPMLLVDGLLELRQPVAPAHALGATEDLLAPPQQLRTWLGFGLGFGLGLGLGLGGGFGLRSSCAPPRRARSAAAAVSSPAAASRVATTAAKPAARSAQSRE